MENEGRTGRLRRIDAPLVGLRGAVFGERCLSIATPTTKRFRPYIRQPRQDFLFLLVYFELSLPIVSFNMDKGMALFNIHAHIEY